MKNFHFDPFLLISSVILTAIGLTAIISVAPSLFGVQLFFAIVGLISFFIFSNLDHRIFWSLSTIIYVFALFSLGLTLIIGAASHGATRWIQIGGFGLQFSELLKPFLMCSAAYFLLRLEHLRFRLFLWMGLLVPILLLIFRQPDLGGTLVYLFGFALMLLMSGIDWKILASFVGVFVLSLPVLWEFLAEYQRKRIINFINPSHDVLGTGYNAAQAVITVGSGMLFGVGLGRGTQSHLNFLPEFHTDFIFASLSEEFGFFGSALVLTVIFVLMFRLAILMGRAKEPFTRMVLAGYLGMFFLQAFVNIGMNIGVVPVTGITLPFVSYGGSSLLASFTALGIASNIASFERDLD